MRHELAAAIPILATLLGSPGLLPAQEAPRLPAAPGDPLPVDSAVTVGTLANGLRYYIRENREPRARAELRLVVRAGSILEDDDQLGLAHFVEHMAFNGTEHFAKQELVDYLESIGMRFGPEVNAYTSFDQTVYMLTVPTDSAALMATAFQILEDWAHLQALDHEEVDKERGVVIEEWRLGRGAMARMQEKQLPILFKGSRYAERLPIGKPEVIERFDYATLERFYRDWYRPDLMAVVAVGDFERAAIEGFIRRHFAGLAMPQRPRDRTLYPVPDHTETLFAIASDAEAPFNSVGIYWKQPLREQGTLGAYRQSLVEALYNQMLNTRLFELTQRADPPFLGAFSGQGRFIGAKEVYVLGAGVPDNGIERGLGTLLVEGRRVARFGFTASELERERRELLRSLEQAYAEREKTESADYADEYTDAFLYGEPIPGIGVEFELAQRLLPEIELDEVNRLAREWIVDRNRVVMVNGPLKEGMTIPAAEQLSAVIAAAAATEVTPYEDLAAEAPLVPQPPAPAAIVASEPIEEIGAQRWTLENGVQVLLKPTDFKDDEILMRAWSPGGSSLAPDEAYVAAITASSVVSLGGLGAFNYVDLQKLLAGKAVSVSPYIASLSEGLSGSASPQDVETLFQLAYLYFTAPRRDPDAFQSYRTRMLASLANRGADPRSAFSDTINVTMAQSHFRARPPTVELYQEMDLDRSFDFYRDRFADAGDFTFIFVGSFDPEALKPLIQTYLGGLPGLGRRESWRDEGIRPPSGVIRKDVFRGIEEKSETEIIFTGPFEWTRENRHALASLADLLEIRLREVLREDMGGTYGVGVSAFPSKDPRPQYELSIGFGTAPERLPEMTAAAFAVIDTLKTTGPSQQDIDKVKEMQRRERETSVRENSFWLGQMLGRISTGGDLRDIPQYEQLIDALTAERVRDAARLYLNLENYVQVSLLPEARAQ
jgi:zinc protease